MKLLTARLVVAAALAATTSLGRPAYATSVLPLDLDALVAGARTIVHVRCAGNVVQPDPLVGAVTVTTFVVLDRAKGAPDELLEIRQAGGEIGGLVVDYHVPRFRPGEEFVLFIPTASKLGFASPVGLAQGVFGVAMRDGTKVVGRGRDFARLLARVDPNSLPPGIAAQLRTGPEAGEAVDVREFMTLVRDRIGPR